jgi:hypothetical protein
MPINNLILTMTRAEKLLRASQKREVLLAFLASGETYTTLSVVAELLETSERNALRLLQKMQEEKLIKVDENVMPHTSLKLYGITAHGLAITAKAHPKAREFELSKTNPSWVPHHIEGQQIRIVAERVGWTEYVPGKLLMVENSGRLKKLPDALITRPDGRRCAIEIERFIKSKTRHADAISGHLTGIINDHYELVYYFTPHLEALERVFASVQTLLVDENKIQLSASHRARFKVFGIDIWKGEM